MHTNSRSAERIAGAVYGALVGDALGVPVEFTTREQRDRDPVTSMRGHGTWNQPAGTWSDDGALLLCTAESLLDSPGDLEAGGRNFVRWLREGRWAVRGKVFDVGGATRAALSRIESGAPAALAGGTAESDNGNGSLMRILPVALNHWRLSPYALAGEAMRWSALTHRHPRSQLACACYCAVVQELLQGAAPTDAVRKAGKLLDQMLVEHPVERPQFQRILDGSLAAARREETRSSGYVIDTLEAALWCLLQGGGYTDVVLRAVNLGGDTDTTGCVAGGLAGAWLGREAIPRTWLATLATDPSPTELVAGLTAGAA